MSIGTMINDLEQLAYYRDLEFFSQVADKLRQLKELTEAASHMNELLNNYDLVRQHSYAHEQLSRALLALKDVK